jgi:hypothetical protein
MAGKIPGHFHFLMAFPRRHCEERSEEAIQFLLRCDLAGLLRFARNDEAVKVASEAIRPLEGQGPDCFVAGTALERAFSAAPVGDPPGGAGYSAASFS